MSRRLEALLETVQRPARYTGGEVNAIQKDWAGRTTFCFAFPDTYEVAMSHLGMKVLYEAVNREDDLLCERAMMPWVDLLEGLKREGIPLFSLESRRALSDFDAIGFTLQYEMSYTNILTMLELGGVALRVRVDRSRFGARTVVVRTVPLPEGDAADQRGNHDEPREP